MTKHEAHTGDRRRLRAIRSAISPLLIRLFSDQMLEQAANLRKPSSFRRRRAKKAGPWQELMDLLLAADRSDNSLEAATKLLALVQRLRALRVASDESSFFVLTELVSFLVTSRDLKLTEWRLIAELRRVHEPEIADLLQADPAEYANKRERGRIELSSLEGVPG